MHAGPELVETGSRQVRKLFLENREAAEKQQSMAWARSLLAHVPASVAGVDDAWKGNGDRTIVLVRDAHTNPSCQLNEARLFEGLFGSSEAPAYVFLEAGSGDLSLSFLRKYASKEKRLRAARSFLVRGKLQGGEYLDLTSDTPARLYGVEDMGLYAKSVELYRRSASRRARYEEYLRRIDAAAEALKSRFLNPMLLEFCATARRHREGEMSSAEYARFLWSRRAMTSAGEASDYPHLRTLVETLEKESRIDFGRAQEEQRRFMASLSEARRRELSAASASKAEDVQKAYFLTLADLLGGSSEYPNLTAYVNYFKAAQTLDAQGVLNDERRLETDVIARLTVGDEERKLVAASAAAATLLKLCRLQMMPDEYEAYRKDASALDIRELTGFVNHLIIESGADPEKAVFLEDGYDELVKICESFYELTRERDVRFLENIERAWKELPAASDRGYSVLVTGGYHTADLKALLREKGISYVSVTPQVLQETDQRRYEEILLGQKPAAGFPAAPAAKAAANMPMGIRMTEGAVQSLIAALELSPEAAQAALEDMGRTPVMARGSAVIEPYQKAGRTDGARLAETYEGARLAGKGLWRSLFGWLGGVRGFFRRPSPNAPESFDALVEEAPRLQAPFFVIRKMTDYLKQKPSAVNSENLGKILRLLFKKDQDRFLRQYEAVLLEFFQAAGRSPADNPFTPEHLKFVLAQPEAGLVMYLLPFFVGSDRSFATADLMDFALAHADGSKERDELRLKLMSRLVQVNPALALPRYFSGVRELFESRSMDVRNLAFSAASAFVTADPSLIEEDDLKYFGGSRNSSASVPAAMVFLAYLEKRPSLATPERLSTALQFYGPGLWPDILQAFIRISPDERLQDFCRALLASEHLLSEEPELVPKNEFYLWLRSRLQHPRLFEQVQSDLAGFWKLHQQLIEQGRGAGLTEAEALADDTFRHMVAELVKSTPPEQGARLAFGWMRDFFRSLFYFPALLARYVYRLFAASGPSSSRFVPTGRGFPAPSRTVRLFKGAGSSEDVPIDRSNLWIQADPARRASAENMRILAGLLSEGMTALPAIVAMAYSVRLDSSLATVEFVEPILPYLSHGGDNLKKQAVIAVRNFVEASPALARPSYLDAVYALRSDPSFDVRETALGALAPFFGPGRLSLPEATLEEIEAMMGDRLPGIRQTALRTVSELVERAPGLASPRRLEPVLQMLGSYDEFGAQVIGQALPAFEKATDPDMAGLVQALRFALRQDEVRTSGDTENQPIRFLRREFAAWAASQCGNPRAYADMTRAVLGLWRLRSVFINQGLKSGASDSERLADEVFFRVLWEKMTRPTVGARLATLTELAQSAMKTVYERRLNQLRTQLGGLPPSSPDRGRIESEI